MNLQLPVYTIAVMAVSLSLNTAVAQEGLPTLEEAVALSQKTGRPILAMAGQKT